MRPRSCRSAVEALEVRNDGLMDVTAFAGVECRRASRLGRYPGYRTTSMCSSFHRTLMLTAVVMAATAVASPARAAGRIDANTVVAIPHGKFSGVQYTRYEAMFEGVSSNGRPYRVPCQIIAPLRPRDGSGLLLFDWLARPTIATAPRPGQPGE